MTKEEVLKGCSEEDAVLDRSSVHSHAPAHPVIHQVASVPMPSDTGKSCVMRTFDRGLSGKATRNSFYC